MQSASEVGFLKSLFDFQLRHFITMRVLRVLYAISAVIISIAGGVLVLYSLFGFFTGRGAMSLLTLIFAPIVTLLYLILARLWIEFLANLYRIGDNTQKLVDQIPA